MVEPMAQVAIALPVTIALAGGAACLEETRWLTFCCQLLTTRLTRVLRFQSGKVRARARSCAEPGWGCLCRAFAAAGMRTGSSRRSEQSDAREGEADVGL
jgi:predicted alpha/beta-hydrolase family hydrolase